MEARATSRTEDMSEDRATTREGSKRQQNLAYDSLSKPSICKPSAGQLIGPRSLSQAKLERQQQAATMKRVCWYPPESSKPPLAATTTTTTVNHCHEHVRHQPISRMTTTATATNLMKNYSRQPFTTNLVRQLVNLLILNTILGQLSYITSQLYATSNDHDNNELANRVGHAVAAVFPRIIFADAIECQLDGDCGSKEKICHENKCICARDKPIEDQDRCLALALINDPCELSEQCLGNSFCVEGTCSCGSDGISLFNPSTQIFYCHPKRRLNQECNYDVQCPTNSYCSSVRYGCVCQNGFAPSNVTGPDAPECVPKTCTNSSTCESEFHQCDDGKCKCLATHFDPTSGQCYKFGSTGGKPVDPSTGGNLTGLFDTENNFYTTFKDLMKNSDNMWLVLIVLVALTFILLMLIFILVRKHYLGYCWTAHKNEYAPNNKNAPKNGHFNKNSINNKSFRKKNGELDDDEDQSAEDRSTLVPQSGLNGKNSSSKSPFMTHADSSDRSYVKVNINDSQTSDLSTDSRTQYHHQLSPLASSTSTPV